MKVLLVFDGALPAGAVPAGREPSDEFLLFPLTSEGRHAASAAEALRPAAAVVADTAALVNRAAVGIRAPLIGFCGEAAARIGSLLRSPSSDILWRTSQIAEKNPFKSDFFFSLSQFDAIVSFLSENPVDRVIYAASNPKLAAALERHLAERGMPFSLKRPPVRGLRRRLLFGGRWPLARHSLLLLIFAFKYLLRWARIRYSLGPARPGGRGGSLPVFAYHPYFDEDAARRGIFRHRHCLELQEAFEGGGGRISWVLIYADNPAMRFDQAISAARNLRDSGVDLCFPEQFLGLADQFSALFKMLYSAVAFSLIERKAAGLSRFRGYGFHDILRDDWYSSFGGRLGYEGLLFYAAFSRILPAFSAPRVLYFCEMHAWEKALIYAKERGNIPSRLLGYQSGTVSGMLLNYFNSPEELVRAEPPPPPKPDRILCCGQEALDRLRESGWEEGRLALVEGVRYSYLKELPPQDPSLKEIALILLSIDQREGRAILASVIQALDRAPGFEVLCRPHPFLPFNALLREMGLDPARLPFRVETGPLQPLMRRAKVVVGGETGLVVEALAFGASVITLDCPECVNMSPLRDFSHPMVHRAGSPDSLRAALEQAMSEPFSPAMEAEGGRLSRKFFCLDYPPGRPVRFLSALSAGD